MRWQLHAKPVGYKSRYEAQLSYKSFCGMETFRIIWDNKEVGELINPLPDMWYLEGNWKSNGTVDSEQRLFSDTTFTLEIYCAQINPT